MTFAESDPIAHIQDPAPFGVAVDSEVAALYDEYAADSGFADIYRLWCYQDITDLTIRQRMVAALTAPYGHELPYPHEGQSIGSLMHQTEMVGGSATNSLRRRFAHRTELATEIAQGVLYWLGATENSNEPNINNTRGDYQHAILELLPIVDDKMADRLFARYVLNDPQPYINAEDSSGYSPLTKLLRDPEIAQWHKDTALEWWLSIAEEEQAGQRAPRVEHERAIDRMAEFVQTWSLGDTEVNKTVIAKLVAFLETNTPRDTPYVNSYAVGKLVRHIIPAHKETRFSFGQRHIFSGPAKDGVEFRIENGADRNFVAWMRQMANDQGSMEFNAKADALIEDFDSRHQAAIAVDAGRLALVDRMRALGRGPV